MRTVFKYSAVAAVIIAGIFTLFKTVLQNDNPPQVIVEKVKTADDSAFAEISRPPMFKDSVNIIGPGDVLRIWITDERDLDRQVLVQSNGGIRFSFLDEIQASGLTVAEVKDEIRSGFIRNRYILNPEVNVSVIETLH